MNPLSTEMAKAHIADLRRDACRSQLARVARSARRQRRTATTNHRFAARFLPVPTALFHH